MEQFSGPTESSTSGSKTVDATVTHKHSVEVDDRLHVLRETREKVSAQREALLKQAEQAYFQLHVIDGQIYERSLDVENSSRPIKLPYYQSKEELDTARNERGNSFRGTSKEDIKIQREKAYQKEATDWINVLAKKQALGETGTPQDTE
jgi:recombinational DNA repair ATPase RecF